MERLSCRGPRPRRGGTHLPLSTDSRKTTPWTRSEARAGPRRLLAGALLLLLFSPVFLYRLGRTGLRDPDEGRNAEVAREMLVTGDWITPRINGARYLDKPPAFFWTVALAYRTFGVNELAARMPSAIFALAGIGLTVWFARRHLGPRAGWLSGIILATTPLYIVFGRMVIFDMMLAFFTTAAAMAAFEAMEGDGRRARFAGIAFFTSAAAGTLTKGPVALVAPLLVAVAWAVLRGRPGLLRRMGWGSGALIYAAIVLPWLVLVSAHNPGYLRYALLGENLERMTSNRFDTARPFYFYVKVVLSGFFPWVLYCGAAAGRGGLAWLRGAGRGAIQRAGWRKGLDSAAERSPALLYAGLWLGVMWLFFSLVVSKRISYILPCAVPVALLGGGLWAASFGSREGAEDGSRVATARRDLSLGTAWVAASCIAGALVLALVSLGVGPGVSGGKYDVLLTRAPLFGWTAAGLAGSAAVLLATRRLRRPALSFGLAVALIGVMIPLSRAVSGYVDMARSARPVSRFLAGKLSPQDRVICYDEYRPSLNFYLRRPIDVVDDPGKRIFTSNYVRQNLAANLHDPSFHLISGEAMRDLLRRAGPGVYLLAPRESYAALVREAVVPLETIYEDFHGGVFVRAGAHPPH
jgi:4-amino-4-deoxy-L-arabinose transferase-like glycosyltransferase